MIFSQKLKKKHCIKQNRKSKVNKLISYKQLLDLTTIKFNLPFSTNFMPL